MNKGKTTMNWKETTWQGYGRQNGAAGIRNKVLVIYTVECASFVAQEVVRQTGRSNVEVVGFSGCTDNEYAVRLLIALIRHPNVGAVLSIGLGCEYVQPEWLSRIAAEEGKPTRWFFIQNEGGTLPSVQKGLRCVDELCAALTHTPRVPMRFCDLVIGAECGGSDYTSGLAGNVVVGRLFDQLVDAGGTALFEEIVEAVGLIDVRDARAATAEACQQLVDTYDKALDYCKSVRQYSVSPGNFTGGLSTIEEKSMGAIVKSGTKPIEGVVKVSQQPDHAGLWLLDSTPDPYWMQFGITNPNDNEGLMDLISAGCHLTFLVTGRGNVVGSAVAPVLKITGNHQTYTRMEGDMDFDASPMLTGHCSQDELTGQLAGLVCAVAAGQPSKSEALGHKEYFIPYKYQECIAQKRCAQQA